MSSARGVASDVGRAGAEVVAGFYDAFNRGDIDAAVEFLDPGFEWRPAFGRALMGDNVYHGHEGFSAYYRDLNEAFAEYRVEVERLEQIEVEVLLAHVSAGGTGRTSGASIARRFVIRYEVQGGLIVYGQTFGDRAQAAAARVH
jgi:ketosteroid isomerase-like protein